ncbi:MAG: glycosyltransferase family 4 protein [Crocinitomicaceae bacterium]|nr:glycosyltransferase family 4 protein [Crocinitomicaceae bacterium]
MCTSRGWGGLEMNHLRNALWMKSRGHEITLVCTKNSPLEKAGIDAELSVISIRKPARHYAFLSAWMLMLSLHKRGVKEVFIRNTSDISLGASIAFFSFKRIHIHFFMELMFQDQKQQLYRTIRYSFLSSWVCSLEYMKHKVLSSTRIDPNKVCVIPSALDFSQISPFTKSEAREQLNVPLDKVIFGMIGRIDRKKRIELAILALHQLQNSQYQLLIVGEETPDSPDSYLSELKQLIQEKKLVDQVHFFGFHSETSPFYHAIDALIMASDFETFGMSTIEALAHHTPVIATNSGGSQELLHRFPLGILVEPGNPTSFVMAMGKITALVPENFDNKGFQTFFDHNRICEIIESRILSCESVR